MHNLFTSIHSIILTTAALFFSVTGSHAQCVINSNAGYSVSVTICPQSIEVSTTDCPWGYNYNVRFDYQVEIIGSTPGNGGLNKLQTKVYCNNSAVNGYYSLPLQGGTGTALTTTNPYVPNAGAPYQYGSNPSCTQATIASLNCVSIGLIIQGSGIPNQEINCNCSSLMLPVEFLSFDGETTAEGNLLTWETQSENRNDYFTIETSSDGISWKELAQVKGAVNSTEKLSYSYLDTKHPQESIYYKLSQTDLDGSRNELSMKYISAEDSDFLLYPNPSSGGQARLAFSAQSGSKTSLILRNEFGQIIYNTELEEASKSGKTAYFDSMVSLDQPSGVYLVEVMADNQVIKRSRLLIR